MQSMRLRGVSKCILTTSLNWKHIVRKDLTHFVDGIESVSRTKTGVSSKQPSVNSTFSSGLSRTTWWTISETITPISKTIWIVAIALLVSKNSLCLKPQVKLVSAERNCQFLHQEVLKRKTWKSSWSFHKALFLHNFYTFYHFNRQFLYG